MMMTTTTTATATKMETIRMLWSYNAPYLIYHFRSVSFSSPFILRLLSSSNASITSIRSMFLLVMHQDYSIQGRCTYII